MRSFGLILLALALTSYSSAAPPSASADVTAVRPLTYKRVGNRELKILWTKPADWQPTGRRGAVVFFHGGGWVAGDPSQFEPQSVELARRGIVCFRVEYRFVARRDQSPPDVCVEDASDAMRFVRARSSELGVDPERIAAAGGSAGGHLAAYVGMMDDAAVDGVSRKPNALLLFNPVSDNGPGEWGHARVLERFRDYSPAHNISADDPPAIAFLGTADSLIPVATAERFRDAMRDVGLRSELRLYPNQAHGFFNRSAKDPKHYQLTLDESVAFLDSLGWFAPAP